MLLSFIIFLSFSVPLSETAVPVATYGIRSVKTPLNSTVLKTGEFRTGPADRDVLGGELKIRQERSRV